MTAVIIFPVLAASGALSQAVSFTTSLSPHSYGLHADFNSDGREDFITRVSGCSGFALVLSTGNNTYAAPVCYALPSGRFATVAIGDFNNDGNADVIAVDGTNKVYEYLGSKSGQLHLQATFSSTQPAPIDSVAAADVNHDGKIDLLFACSDAVSSCSDQNLHVWFGNGTGGFTVGPSSPILTFGSPSAAPQLSVGDFDGDGNADVLIQGASMFAIAAQVVYGDGAGHFTATPSFAEFSSLGVADVNGDGRMDLITAPYDISPNGQQYNLIRIYYGNANRTFTTHQITLASCTLGSPPAVADLNGDGINDIVVVEGPDCNKGHVSPDTVNVLLGNANGTYQSEQVIYSGTSSEQLFSPSVVRLNQDSKPDFILNSSASGTGTYLFDNTTIGNFPSCSPPNRYDGITLCAPTSTVASSSPVKFSVGAANQTLGRKVEVWVDSKKQSEQLKHAFSYYSFLDASYNLASGQHSVTVYSAGWDNLLQKFTFPLTVGSSTCAPPMSPGVNVCSPISNSTIGSTAQAWASGTVSGTIARMEVWVDGVKKFSTYNSHTLKTNITLASGNHTFTYFVINTAGQKWSQTVHASVP
jgi:hypothetical protein